MPRGQESNNHPGRRISRDGILPSGLPRMPGTQQQMSEPVQKSAQQLGSELDSMQAQRSNLNKDVRSNPPLTPPKSMAKTDSTKWANREYADEYNKRKDKSENLSKLDKQLPKKKEEFEAQKTKEVKAGTKAKMDKDRKAFVEKRANKK